MDYVMEARDESRQAKPVRSDWNRAEAEALYALPFADLMFRARAFIAPISIRTMSRPRACSASRPRRLPEDCGYCSQSAHYDTGLKATRLMDQADVVSTAQRAKEAGASRFCMAAAWRNPKDRDLDQVCDMVSAVKGSAWRPA